MFGCKTCGKKVKPKKGRLICCGYNEPIPKRDTNYCKECGGKKKGYYDDYFIMGCHCHDSMYFDQDNYDTGGD